MAVRNGILDLKEQETELLRSFVKIVEEALSA